MQRYRAAKRGGWSVGQGEKRDSGYYALAFQKSVKTVGCDVLGGHLKRNRGRNLEGEVKKDTKSLLQPGR